MKKLQGYLTGGGVATMQLFAVLLLFMVAPYGANASGGTDFYYIYNTSTCSGSPMWAGTCNVPLSSHDRQMIQATGGTHYERASSAGICRAV